MSKSNTREKINFVLSCYNLTGKWKDTIIKELIPILNEKQKKKVLVDD